MKSPRFWLVILLLAATAFVLQTRGDTDYVPASQPLSQMPEQLDGLTSQDIPLTDDTLAVLGKGDFLNRVYVGPLASTNSHAVPISLFIGYFPSQRTGQTMHSPQNCLPGAGWTFDSQKYASLQDVNGKNYKVGEYVISNGYKAKLYMIADAIRMNRTDGALVRVITQVLPSESLESARERATQFTQQMAPNLPRFIPD
jgi:hypothetical protein